MRTTLSLDDDIVALLGQLQSAKDITMKQLVNEALRQGLGQMANPEAPKLPFQTRPVDLGTCHFATLDNTWDVLAASEGESYK